MLIQFKYIFCVQRVEIVELDYYKIGQRIRKARKVADLSQEQLAEKVNISITHMSHIETGNTKLSLPVLADIAQTLQVKTDSLLFETAETDYSRCEELAEMTKECSDKEMQLLADVLRSCKKYLRK